MDFTRPFREWAVRPPDQRYETMEALKQAVYARTQRSRTFDVELGDLEVQSTDTGWGVEVLAKKTGLPALIPNNWAFGQLCQRAKAPASYLRTLGSGLTADCLNFSLAGRCADKDEDLGAKLLVQSFDDYATLGAATSQKYGRIFDLEIVKLVEDMVGQSGGSFYPPPTWEKRADGTNVPGGLYASDRDCFIFLINGGSIVDSRPSTDHRPRELHKGFYVANSEVGSRTFQIAMFLFDQVCGNHQLWGAQAIGELRIRHSTNAPGRFIHEAMPQLIAHTQASVKPLEDMIQRAQEYAVPDKLDMLVEWARPRSITGTEVRGAIERCKAEERVEFPHTLWLLQSSLTAYARDLAFADARVDLERRAGKLMQLVAA